MTYLSNETGAVTVDWVVLTAGLVGLGMATMAVVSSGVQDTSQDVSAQLSGDGLISTDFFANAFGVPEGSLLAAHFDGDVMSGGAFSDEFLTAYADQRATWCAINTGSCNSGQTPTEWVEWVTGVYANYDEAGLQSRMDNREAGRDGNLSIRDGLAASIGLHDPDEPTAAQLASEAGIFSAANWQNVLDAQGSADAARQVYDDLATYDETERLAFEALLNN